MLHVVVHLLLLISSIVIILKFIILIFMEVSLALFVYLVFHIIIFKHEILFVPVMFVKLSLLFWGQLLSQMMSTCLSQRYDSGFFLASSLSNLHV